MRKIIIIIGFLCLISISLSAQEEKKNAKNEKKTIHVTEENLQFYLDKNPFVIIYFYSKWNPDSVKMLNILKKVSVKGNPSIFLINVDTNLGLRLTFKIEDYPSLIVLKERKLLYGLTGYLDDPEALSEFINNGIKLSIDE